MCAPANAIIPEHWKPWLRRADFFFVGCTVAILSGLASNVYRGVAINELNLALVIGTRGAIAYFSFRIGAQLWHRIP